MVSPISPLIPLTELAEVRSSPTLVNVWASWCIPCVNELPLFADIRNHHSWNVVFVNIDSDPSLAQSFLKEHNLQWVGKRTIYDKKLAVMRKLNLRGVPATFGYTVGEKTKTGAFALFEGEIKKGQLSLLLRQMEAIHENP